MKLFTGPKKTESNFTIDKIRIDAVPHSRELAYPVLRVHLEPALQSRNCFAGESTYETQKDGARVEMLLPELQKIVRVVADDYWFLMHFIQKEGLLGKL